MDKVGVFPVTYLGLGSMEWWPSLVAQMVKHLPTMQETWVLSLGREDPLEKAVATHSSTLAWRIPWREEPDRLHPWGHKESDTTERFHSLTLPYFWIRSQSSVTLRWLRSSVTNCGTSINRLLLSIICILSPKILYTVYLQSQNSRPPPCT